ncbi:family 10 glycosylhydrolase [Paenibacillus dakarensis]|uniref:family 10 glycosylhydrolase n=1 Tax=Paenibacillus dakarensis TaxID=1527293 RepID=UPI0006D57EE1|nr:family 10 glycosylhydrolase [Paenibacillus dakarensis]
MKRNRKVRRSRTALSWAMALLMLFSTIVSGQVNMIPNVSAGPLTDAEADISSEPSPDGAEDIHLDPSGEAENSADELTEAPADVITEMPEGVAELQALSSSTGIIEPFENLSLLQASAVRATAHLGLVSRPETIYDGNHAVQLSYDFTGTTGTSAAYINFKDPNGSAGRTIPGKPMSMGLWVYGDGANHWLRAQVQGADGTKTALDLTSSTGLSWTGWKYITFQIPASIPAPVKLTQIYVTELKDTNKNSGSLYFDRLTAMYSSSKIYALDIAGITPMKTGETQRPDVYVTSANMTEPALVTAGVTFKSNNESVIKVTGATYDTLYAAAPGEALITVQYGDSAPAVFNVSVTDEEVSPQQVILSGPVHLETSMTGQIKAYAVYAGYDYPLQLADGVTFVSSHPDIVSVNNDGQLTALSSGSAVITVSFKGVQAEHSVTVTAPVPVLQGIELLGMTGISAGDSFETKTLATYTWLEEPVELTDGVVFSSSRPDVASVDEKGVVTGLKVGASRITASYEGKTTSLYITVHENAAMPKAEMRAAWIATVENIDWPVKGADPAAQKQQYIDLLDQLQDVGMNAVIMQIKPTADAFYPSEYGPWSEWLTGVQGKDPGYNPLEFLIEETHKRNMEFHAWFNPYRISMKDDINKLVENHPARQHPEWVESYGGKLLFNPGIPAAQQFILDSVMEVVKNYDIDAVHFDDYFYPYPAGGVDFPDDDTYAEYGQGFTNKGDWRRDNVNQFVKNMSEAIKAEKSYVKFGISPFGIWKNKSAAAPDGSETNGLSSYDSIYADSKKWVEEEWIDYITPQIYWYRGYAPAAYDKLIEWWSGVTAGKNVQLYSGQAVYRINTVDSWLDPEEMPNQILYNRSFEEVAGSMYFSAKWFADNLLNFSDRLRDDLYRYPALVPAMPWLDNTAPSAPVGVTAKSGKEGIQLNWRSKDDETYYVIYRFEDKEPLNTSDPSNIVRTVRKQAGVVQTYLDTTALEKGKYRYVVTAVDRLHNESIQSGPATVHVK